LVGNGVATVVVAKWCNQLDEKQLKDTLNNKNTGADKRCLPPDFGGKSPVASAAGELLPLPRNDFLH
ncbi:hypothetical protein ISX56_30195, partial [Serratia ureilytica]|nr:hypothetical protein [Serratia ureilytica]